MTVKVTNPASVPITNDRFSFGGSFYASGTFNSRTTASGAFGFSGFYIPNCGTVTGTGSWSATWQNSSQLTTVPTEVVEPDTGEPATTTGDSYTVTLVK